MRTQRRCAFGRLGVFFAVVGAICAPADEIFAVTPKSPEVKKLIEQGIKYLEKNEDNRFGGRCLVAMTLIKAGEDVSHPLVQKAVEECKSMATNVKIKENNEEIYSLGIAVLFLCELDVEERKKELKYFLDVLQHRQKKHGGWGYENQGTGDTSMTQYGVLSAWTAKQVGFNTPDDSIERVANWLIRTQDPSGGWGYQGVDPGTYDKKETQSEVRLSLTTAALGSVLIAANLLSIVDIQDDGDPLPPALVLVQDEKKGPANKVVDAGRLRAAIGAGTIWFRDNYKIDPDGFTHYYMYALERFMSFKELIDGKKIEEPTWYNEGYKYLASTQKENGSWESQGGAPADTAFAILFLIRSTRKAIEKMQSFGPGTLVGGRGLPKDTKDVKLRGGKLLAKNQAQAVEDILKALGDPDEEDLDALAEEPEEIELSEKIDVRTAQLKHLRQVVRSGPPKARLAAVKALGRSREVEYVPLMIYALTDPDPHVAVAADEALRFMSRRLGAARMKIPPDEAAREAAVEYWKDWFTKLHPDMALEE